MREGHFIYKKKYKLHYRIFGEGTETVFCFHGFGQDSEVFSQLPQKLKGKRIISIDLPFHGKSEFPREQINKKKWDELSMAMLIFFEADQVSLVAYSLGGRFVIRFAIDHPEKIKDILFIAADGFHYATIYRFATSFLGKSLFKHVLKNPDKLFRLSDLLVRYNILNPSIVKFAKSQLGQKSQRIRVYDSWLYLKGLMTSQNELIRSLNESHIPVSIYVGSKDYVIKEEYFRKVDENCENVELNILAKRHHEMIEGYINETAG